MELRDIEYFAVIAERRHLGRAAEALGLGTPALSKCLKRLETTLQVELVRRTPKGVELTTEGAALHAQVHKLQVSLSDVAREISALGKGQVGSLRVGTAAEGAGALLETACGALLKDASKVMLSIVAWDSHTILPALRNGEMDIIISPVPEIPYDDLVQEDLLEDDFVVCASRDHPLSKRKQVSLEDLVRERWALTTSNSFMWRNLQRAFEAGGLPAPQLCMVTVNTTARLRTVASTNILGFFTRRMLRESEAQLGLVALPLKKVLWRRRLAVGYRRDAYLSPVARRFIDLLKRAAKEIPDEQSG